MSLTRGLTRILTRDLTVAASPFIRNLGAGGGGGPVGGEPVAWVDPSLFFLVSTLDTTMSNLWGVRFGDDGKKLYMGGAITGLYYNSVDFAAPYVADAGVNTAVAIDNSQMGSSVRQWDWGKHSSTGVLGQGVIGALITGSTVHQYDLQAATAYAPTTAVNDGFDTNPAVSGTLTTGYKPNAVKYADDGNKIIVTSNDASTGYSADVFNLSTPYDISTVVSTIQSTYDGGDFVMDMQFDGTGLSGYVLLFTTSVCYLAKFTCSTAWDLSTASVGPQVNITTLCSLVDPVRGFEVTPDGTGLVLWTWDNAGADKIYMLSTTSAFTNVSLLLPFDGADTATTSEDLSAYGHTLTFNADAKLLTNDQKFGVSSAFFDGGTDHISIPNSEAFNFGSGDYTIEGWFKLRVGGGSVDRCIISKWDSGSGAYRNWLLFVDATDDRLEFFCSPNGSTTRVFNGDANAVVSEDTWHHFAISKVSGVTRGFLDGIKCMEQTFDEDVFNGTADIHVGRIQGSSGGLMDFWGWIDDIRITKGVGRYIANFNVPTEAYPTSNGTVLSANTVSQLSFEGDLSDDTLRTWSAYGDAAVSSAYAKDGTQSVTASASAGNYIGTPDAADLHFADDDFTIEFWYKTPASFNAGSILAGQWSGAHATRQWCLYMANTGGLLQWIHSTGGVSPIQSITTLTASTEYHIAAARDGTVIRFYIDGTQVAIDNTADVFNSSGLQELTLLGTSVGNNSGGHIDMFRVINGTCLYPDGTAFTPPATF